MSTAGSRIQSIELLTGRRKYPIQYPAIKGDRFLKKSEGSFAAKGRDRIGRISPNGLGKHAVIETIRITKN
jgi:hypothetical protein